MKDIVQAKSLSRVKLATTIAELHEKCAPYSDAAVASAEFGAIIVWLMGAPPPETGMSVADIGSLALYGRRAAIYSAGLPHPCGRELVDPKKGLPEAEVASLQAGAEQVLLGWRAAGSPCLTARGVTQEHQCFIAARRAAGHAV